MHEDANGNKGKRNVLLEDEASYWLLIWMVASSLDLKVTKQKKKSKPVIFPKYSHVCHANPYIFYIHQVKQVYCMLKQV